MASNVLPGAALRPDRLSDLGRPEMAKAEVIKQDVDRYKRRIGQAIDRARILAGLTLREFAAAIGRDERQVSRWMAGEDRPQFDLIFAVESLRFPLIEALSELAQADVRVVIDLPRRRRA